MYENDKNEWINNLIRILNVMKNGKKNNYTYKVSIIKKNKRKIIILYN